MGLRMQAEGIEQSVGKRAWSEAQAARDDRLREIVMTAHGTGGWGQLMSAVLVDLNGFGVTGIDAAIQGETIDGIELSTTQRVISGTTGAAELILTAWLETGV